MITFLFRALKKGSFAVLVLAIVSLLPTLIPISELIDTELEGFLNFLGDEALESMETIIKLLKLQSIPSEIASFLGCTDLYRLQLLRLLIPLYELRLQCLLLLALSFVAYKSYCTRRIDALHALTALKLMISRALQWSVLALFVLSMQQSFCVAVVITLLELLIVYLIGAYAAVTFGYDSV